MKKEFRIKKKEEFQSIIKGKRFVTNDSFVIYYRTKKESHSRVGISVPTKMGIAVKRNKIKRQCRMMISQNFPMNEDYDYVVIVRKKYDQASFAENTQLFLNLIDLVKTRKTRRTHDNIHEK